MITIQKKEIELIIRKNVREIIVTPKRVTIELHRGLPGPKGDPGIGVPAGGAAGQILAKRTAENYETEWILAPSNAEWGSITGTLGAQTDLVGWVTDKEDEIYRALDEKADETEIEALEAQIAAKADAEHTHAIEDVTGLQTELDLKADESEIISLEAEIAEKAALSHGHAQSDITGLTTALDAKANTADLGTLAAVDDAPADGKQYTRKNNAWAEAAAAAVWGAITGNLVNQTDLMNHLGDFAVAVQSALDQKAALSHIHDASAITSGILPVARGGTGGTDSRWLTLTNSTVFTGTINYRKIGNTVSVCASAIHLAQQLNVGSNRILATLPSGYFLNKAHFSGAAMTSTASGKIRVFPILFLANGNIQLYTNSDYAITTDTYLAFAGTFITS